MSVYHLSFICFLLFVISPPLSAKKEAHNGNAYRILAFLPIPSKSHQRVWQPLLRELVNRGHHVTYVTPIPLDDPPASNFTQLRFMDDEIFMKNIMSRTGTMNSDIMTLRGFTKHFHVIKFTRDWGLAMLEEVLENPQIIDFIKSDLKFDAVILESSFIQESLIALQHRYKAVVIEILTTSNWNWAHWLHGNPSDPNYIVDCSVPFSDRMTLLEKMQNMMNGLITRLVNIYYMPSYQKVMDDHLKYPGWQNRPSMGEMLDKTSMVLVNTHFSLNYPYPTSQNFKDVGGLNLVPIKPLPKDIKDFMDRADDGVIYFTLGSFWPVSETLGDKLTKVFINVFSKLKQRVLMKWEKDFPNLPSNIMIGKWFPQQDILAHKNMRLFISHGGLLSLTEAINCGIPILGIPMLGDQVRNIRHAQHFGYGIALDLDTINEITLSWAIEEILEDPRYTENAKKRSELFRDKPETALETAVYWTEYVIRHKGAEHLRPAIASMPWYQQAMIDVYSAMAAIVLIPIYLIYRVVRFLCRCCSKANKRTKKKNE